MRSGEERARNDGWNAAEVAANGTFHLRVGYRDVTAYTSAVEELVETRVAGRIGERDHTLWGPAAESEAAKRLAWRDFLEVKARLEKLAD